MTALALTVLFALSGATSANAPCVAEAGLKLSTKGRFVDVDAKTTITVIADGAPWTTVEVDGVRGKIWSEKLQALCHPADVPPAGTTPPEAIPTDPSATTPTPHEATATPALATGVVQPTEGDSAASVEEATTTTTTVPPASAASATTATTATTEEATPDAPAARRPLPRTIRVAVRPFQASKADAHLARVTTDALVAELRKLERLSVVDMEEVKALLDLEAEKQLVGCEDESCLAEIVEALGADVLIVGSVSTLEQERVFGLKRLDAHDLSGSSTFSKRLAIRGGEECLAAVGIATEKLFADFPLKPGRTRGVAPEVAIRLTPPPLPAWVTYTAFGVTAVAGAATLAAGVANAVAYSNGQEALQAGSGAIDAAELNRHNQEVSNTFALLVAAGTTTAIAGAFSVVGAVWLTDWDDLAAEMEKARAQE